MHYGVPYHFVLIEYFCYYLAAAFTHGSDGKLERLQARSLKDIIITIIIFMKCYDYFPRFDH